MFLFLFFNLFCTFSLFTAPFPVDSLLLQTDISPELQEKACEFSREKCYEILAQRIILDNRQEAHKAEVSKLALLFQRAFIAYSLRDVRELVRYPVMPDGLSEPRLLYNSIQRNFAALVTSRRSFSDCVQDMDSLTAMPKARESIEKILFPDYWMEALGMRFTVEGTIYSGHILSSYFSHDTTYLNDWYYGRNSRGIHYRDLYTFQRYISKKLSPTLPPVEKQALITALNNVVEYYSPKILKTLEAHVFPDGRVYTETSLFNKWTKAFSEQQATSYLEFCSQHNPAHARKGKFVIQRIDDNDPFFIFVLLPNKKWYIQIKVKGSIQHTSISHGKSILASGRFFVDTQGKMTHILGFSGHYQPTNIQMVNMLGVLLKEGFDINSLYVTYLKDPITKDEITIPPGKVLHWYYHQKKMLE